MKCEQKIITIFTYSSDSSIIVVLGSSYIYEKYCNRTSILFVSVYILYYENTIVTFFLLCVFIVDEIMSLLSITVLGVNKNCWISKLVTLTVD